jgi:hypothetical protein
VTVKIVTYFAVAEMSDGKIGQLLVTRETDPLNPTNSRQVSQVWTGVTYKTTRAAFADLKRLNKTLRPLPNI